MANQSLKLDTPAMVDTVRDDERGGFFLGNVRVIGIIGIILLALVAGLFYFFSTQARANEKAQVELARIRPYYDRGEFQIAINGDSSKSYGGQKVNGLKHIVQEWDGTDAGKLAALYLGNSYLGLGQTDQAREPYEIAAGADADLVRSAAHAGLGAVSEAKGSYEQAAKEFEQAANEDRLELNTPEYLVGAARNYERAQKKEEAIKHYRTVATQYPSSSANTQARMALARYDVQL
jgi:tetratricopeptide (TPR) repeat protein